MQSIDIPGSVEGREVESWLRQPENTECIQAGTGARFRVALHNADAACARRVLEDLVPHAFFLPEDGSVVVMKEPPHTHETIDRSKLDNSESLAYFLRTHFWNKYAQWYAASQISYADFQFQAFRRRKRRGDDHETGNAGELMMDVMARHLVESLYESHHDVLRVMHIDNRDRMYEKNCRAAEILFLHRDLKLDRAMGTNFCALDPQRKPFFRQRAEFDAGMIIQRSHLRLYPVLCLFDVTTDANKTFDFYDQVGKSIRSDARHRVWTYGVHLSNARADASELGTQHITLPSRRVAESVGNAIQNVSHDIDEPVLPEHYEEFRRLIDERCKLTLGDLESLESSIVRGPRDTAEE